MFIKLARVLEGCLVRIRQGESMGSCLERYPDSRRELEPLLNTAICIAATPKAAPALRFSRSVPARLVARLQEDRRLEQVRGAQRDSSVSWGDRLARTFRKPRVMAFAAVAMLFAILGSLTPYLTNLSTPPDTLLSNCTLSIGSGRVEIYVQGAETWRLADNGEVLTTGARLRTSTESQAMLTFFEGSTVLMEPSTEIEIEKLAYSEGGSTTITLKQWMGRTWSRVVTMADPGSHYEIETPSAYALVRGTYFIVDVAQETTVSTMEGLVAVGGQGGEVQVGAGYQTTVTSQGMPAPPTPITDEPSKYTLILASGAGGSVTGPGEGAFTYDADTLVNLHAVAEAGYHFVSWSGAVTNSGAATTSITMTGDTTVTANFEIDATTYTLTAGSSAGGNVTVPGEGVFTYNSGTVVNLQAVAEAGYHFVSWSGTVTNSGAATTTITMAANTTVKANFEIDAITSTTYTLTTGSNVGGNVTAPGEGVFAYASGTVVSLQAVAESGYHFVGWSGAVTNSGAATTSITMTGNTIVTANFEIDIPTYTLTASSGLGGHVTVPGEGAFTYNSGTVVNLQAVAEAGYHFVNWIGPVTNPNTASTTITINGTKAVTAVFAANIPEGFFTLTVISEKHGDVASPGVSVFIYSAGTIVNLEVKAEEKHHFGGWTGDISTIEDPNATTTKIHMDGNYIITASFVKD